MPSPHARTHRRRSGDKDRLSIFDKRGPYLATKKVGKNNPKAEAIKADNEIRMEWNRTVDRAIVSGVPDTEVIELKKTEITDRVKESVEKNGSKPELFGDIVRAAAVLLERLAIKHMYRTMDIIDKTVSKSANVVKEREIPDAQKAANIVKKTISESADAVKERETLDTQKAVNIVETVTDKSFETVKKISKEAECRVHAKDGLAVQQEKKRIPFPINPHRKADVQHKAEQTQLENAGAVRESLIEQIKAEQKHTSADTKQAETDMPPQPKLSVLARRYSRLKEVDNKLKQQNKAIFKCEKKWDRLKKELSGCTGIFKSSRRKELQREIDEVSDQILNMKKRLSSIVKEYRFDSVQVFYKELDAAKKEYLDYGAAIADWEKTYGEKAADPMSIRNRLWQKERIVKEREADRKHQARQKDKGAR